MVRLHFANKTDCELGIRGIFIRHIYIVDGLI